MGIKSVIAWPCQMTFMQNSRTAQVSTRRGRMTSKFSLFAVRTALYPRFTPKNETGVETDAPNRVDLAVLSIR
jgi:hypothetical protein